ncbi:MAG: GNAT family N-acetyltransferase, partial [Rhodoblastus sp.]
MAIPTSRRDSPFDIDVADDFAAVRDDWALLEAQGECTPFQMRAWLEPWYAILAPHFGAAPLFVRVRDAASGAPLMLLPLARRREGGLVVVEFADLGVSDYHAPLLASHAPALYAHESLLWAQIEAALRPADILRFEKAPPFVGAARNPLFDRARRHMNFCAWELRLGAGRAVFEENLPDQAFRRELARKNRRIGGRGRVCFREETDGARLARAFEILCAQRAARFARL